MIAAAMKKFIEMVKFGLLTNYANSYKKVS